MSERYKEEKIKQDGNERKKKNKREKFSRINQQTFYERQK